MLVSIRLYFDFLWRVSLIDSVELDVYSWSSGGDG